MLCADHAVAKFFTQRSTLELSTEIVVRTRRPRSVMQAGRLRSVTPAPGLGYNTFPDFHVKLLKIYHSDDAVIVEVEISGTQTGQWGEIPPMGKKMKVPLLAICVFEADRMICEKIYFDMATAVKQLTG